MGRGLGDREGGAGRAWGGVSSMEQTGAQRVSHLGADMTGSPAPPRGAARGGGLSRIQSPGQQAGQAPREDQAHLSGGGPPELWAGRGALQLQPCPRLACAGSPSPTTLVSIFRVRTLSQGLHCPDGPGQCVGAERGGLSVLPRRSPGRCRAWLSGRGLSRQMGSLASWPDRAEPQPPAPRGPGGRRAMGTVAANSQRSEVFHWEHSGTPL